MAARKKQSVSRKKATRKKATPRTKGNGASRVEPEIVDEIPEGTRLVGQHFKTAEAKARSLKNLKPFGPNNKAKGGYTLKHAKRKNLRDAINTALTCEIPEDIVEHYAKLGMDISGSTFSEAISALIMRRAMTANQRASEKALDQLLSVAPKAVEVTSSPVQEVDPSMLEKLDADDLKALHRIRAKLAKEQDSDQAA